MSNKIYYNFAFAVTSAALSLVFLTINSAQANAASITFNATGTNPVSGGSTNNLGASVTFNDSLGSGQLQVILNNTGSGATVPSDVLTGVFWDYSGSPLSLSLSSATAPTVIGGTPGTNVNLLDVDPTSAIKKEWGFASTTASSGLGGAASPTVTQHYGLGTAGFGINPGFGLSGGQQFSYGIISGYDNPNPAVSNGTFVKDSATFVLSGLPSNFNINNIGNIRFQYGTSVSEPSINPTPTSQPIPEPGALFGLTLIGGTLKVLRNKKPA